MSGTTTSDRRIGDVELPEPGEWTFDPAHTSVTIVARHLMVSKVRGTFRGVAGTIHVAERPEDSWVEAEIDASSIDTRNPDRDAHMRSPDFLDVERYPTIAFRSTELVPLEGPRFLLRGDLTIRGITRRIELEATFEGTATDPWGSRKVAFSAAGEVERAAFGMTWNAALETGGVLVGPTFRVEVEVQAVRAERAAA